VVELEESTAFFLEVGNFFLCSDTNCDKHCFISSSLVCRLLYSWMRVIHLPAASFVALIFWTISKNLLKLSTFIHCSGSFCRKQSSQFQEFQFKLYVSLTQINIKIILDDLVPVCSKYLKEVYWPRRRSKTIAKNKLQKYLSYMSIMSACKVKQRSMKLLLT